MEKYSEQNPSKANFTGNLVIGMSDGLIVPFALAAGLSSAVENNQMIIMAGIASIAAGSIAMGFGGYFSGKPEKDHHAHHHGGEHEKEEIKNDQLDETKKFFANLGLSESLQDQATGEVLKDKDRWMAFRMQYEQGLQDDDSRKAARTGWIIALGYITGGLISISPYFFIEDPGDALKYAACLTLVFLFISGWVKGNLFGVQPLWSGVRLLLTGFAAAAAAYGVAQIFVNA